MVISAVEFAVGGVVDVDVRHPLLTRYKVVNDFESNGRHTAVEAGKPDLTPDETPATLRGHDFNFRSFEAGEIRMDTIFSFKEEAVPLFTSHCCDV